MTEAWLGTETSNLDSTLTFERVCGNTTFSASRDPVWECWQLMDWAILAGFVLTGCPNGQVPSPLPNIVGSVDMHGAKLVFHLQLLGFQRYFGRKRDIGGGGQIIV